MNRTLAAALLLAALPSSALLTSSAQKDEQVAKTSLKVGDAAPDFTLLSDQWKTVKLSDFKGKKNVFLAVYVLAKDFGVGGVDFSCVNSRLDRLELLGSTTGESENVDGEEDIFLALEVAELDGLPLVTKQSEIGSGVADFEGGLGDLFVFLGGRGQQSRRG